MGTMNTGPAVVINVDTSVALESEVPIVDVIGTIKPMWDGKVPTLPKGKYRLIATISIIEED